MADRPQADLPSSPSSSVQRLVWVYTGGADAALRLLLLAALARVSGMLVRSRALARAFWGLGLLGLVELLGSIRQRRDWMRMQSATLTNPPPRNERGRLFTRFWLKSWEAEPAKAEMLSSLVLVTGPGAIERLAEAIGRDSGLASAAALDLVNEALPQETNDRDEELSDGFRDEALVLSIGANPIPAGAFWSSTYYFSKALAVGSLAEVTRVAFGFKRHTCSDGAIWTRRGEGRPLVIFTSTLMGCWGMVLLTKFKRPSLLGRPVLIQENFNTDGKTTTTDPVSLNRANREMLEILGLLAPAATEFDVLAHSWGTFMSANLMMHHQDARRRVRNNVLIDPVCFVGGGYYLYSRFYDEKQMKETGPLFDPYIIQNFFRCLTPWNCHFFELSEQEQKRMHVFIGLRDKLIKPESVLAHLEAMLPDCHVHDRNFDHGGHLMSNNTWTGVELALND